MALGDTNLCVDNWCEINSYSYCHGLRNVQRYLGIIERMAWWCGRNYITERQRRWGTRRGR